jgi:hypothetical protein
MAHGNGVFFDNSAHLCGLSEKGAFSPQSPDHFAVLDCAWAKEIQQTLDTLADLVQGPCEPNQKECGAEVRSCQCGIGSSGTQTLSSYSRKPVAAVLTLYQPHPRLCATR